MRRDIRFCGTIFLALLCIIKSMEMENTKILDLLTQSEVLEFQTDEDVLTIWHREFFRQRKEFLFELNGTGVFACVTKQAALKKIDSFLNRGFNLVSE